MDVIFAYLHRALPLTGEKQCGAQKNVVVGFVHYPLKVCFRILSEPHTDSEYTLENSLMNCSKCQAPVRDTDAVLDAIRVGQEGLDKAEALQFSGS